MPTTPESYGKTFERMSLVDAPRSGGGGKTISPAPGGGKTKESTRQIDNQREVPVA